MKIITFAFGIITILTIVSCEKYLDVDQSDIIEQEHAFIDKNSTRLSILGIYSLMSELVEPMFLAGEVRADLVTANKSANPYIKEFSNNSFSASNPYGSSGPFYDVINNTNDFISQFEDMVANNEMDSTDFIKYKSELAAIRVWTQYQIAKIFGTCKYYTEVLNSENSSDITSYSFEDTAFLRILVNDLTFSDTTVFTSLSESSKWQTIRISDSYVNALLGEIYMDMGEYEKALEKFQEVTFFGDRNNPHKNTYKISAKLRGQDWFEELWYKPWETSALQRNTVFMLGFDSRYNQTNELRNWTLSLNYQVAPVEWFYYQFEDHAFSDEETSKIDFRFFSVVDFESDFRRPYAISKYLWEDRPFVMTRTARITLLKAFCYNALGEYDDAIDELDDIRKRIDFPKINTNQMPDNDNKAIIWLEDIIIQELAYETGFEGQRWFDLMRVAMRRNDPSYLADKVSQKYSEETREEIRTKLMNNSNWYIPVFD